MHGTRLSLFGQPWWSPVNQLQQEVNRVFDYWGNGNRPQVPALPLVNIWEDAESLQLEAELPGYRMEDLEIYVLGNNQITLKGDAQAADPREERAASSGRTFGTFSRVIELPVAVDANKVEAKFDNGILRIRLGKQEEAKPRKIVVKG